LLFSFPDSSSTDWAQHREVLAVGAELLLLIRGAQSRAGAWAVVEDVSLVQLRIAPASRAGLHPLSTLILNRRKAQLRDFESTEVLA